jgi:hypothetical protein
MECYLAIKMKEMLFAGTWMDLEFLISRENIQTLKGTDSVLSLMFRI